MKMNELLSKLPLVAYEGQDIEITDMQQDSRLVTPGTLFICIDGYTVDGHDYVEKAIAKGAVAILAEKPVEVKTVPVIYVEDTNRAMAILAGAFFNYPTHEMNMVAVTGTNGKTTVTHLIEHVLRNVNQVTGLVGTMYQKIGDTIQTTKNTTPDSLTLQRLFASMREEYVDTAVMEVSSHALVLGRVHGCDYDVAVFTNLTQDHLDFHKTMEEYAIAKSLLFAQLGNDYRSKRPKFAVVNKDDNASERMITATAANVVTYGIINESTFRATDIVISGKGTHFTLLFQNKAYPIKMQLVGNFNVYNALAAIAATVVQGVPLETAIASIEAVQGVAGRFELVSAGQAFPVIVDYAHTPDSLENVIQTIRDFAKGRIICVVGCGGDRDRTKRPIMAKIAVDQADIAILTSDNPRTEDPMTIINQMEAGVSAEAVYIKEVSREKAIQIAVSEAQEDDVILIAGKGHETYQIIGDVTHHFDDREVAEEAIKNLK
ncbi:MULTISPECIES: UDP-N-acetylmuramoyl-L-alanyl-D-glutamate--2,6-diaminopimelate ligase [Brochothrix]|uniref:UDP-N-acetylmuramoyl-L-alanyl-D-glutamate--2,6-diaminopimelate ligase n=1 Tax=Brochothrix thermosphacta TaxID=2756 RepID=A0A1D2LWG4_BROTH|nr:MULTISPECIES: UDP-N-acetylmuramoyl-L-alanyl-D-glutamate--2,6-diaminopimelate ligase [Brochothrix]ATF25296.1 UDP-N-acetylmuramoyl-L-alanyl-D-glutamate--2,6-diaminopimelate ligase [Brochothrix thermosphacta]ATH84679.1 UDP-N-acetylmuramoyl-L-alanyl-D-glutamate--2,6-diaminopimelate ligase [Brochothrix thermosphacta]MBR5525855.1 UDP-N-acetylmuramoyl-L-alanyl-D-glutamate--2,6-diaminopimelate ligase [Brochothrix sp.]MPQ27730.1 UDP-N-acetylmuramoyl-L-alanyl-D-glutamate--2,6-diaminopimelate ligase [B